MTEVLNTTQMQKLQEVLRCNIEKMLETINTPVVEITTEILRKYLVEYRSINKRKNKNSVVKIIVLFFIYDRESTISLLCLRRLA